MQEQKKSSAKYYAKQIEAAIDECEAYFEQAKDAYKEYTFSETLGSKGQYTSDRAKHQHLPIFWSSIQTAKPSVYNQTPTPVAKRRFEDKDDVGRVGSLMIERLAMTMLDMTRFDQVMERLVEDRLVVSRGQARVHYNAEMGMSEETVDEFGQLIPAQEIVVKESVEPVWLPFDSVFFTPACRDWSQVTWIAYEQYFDKREFKERFGQIVEQKWGDAWKEKITFNYANRKDHDDQPADHVMKEEAGKFVKVYEIWNKKTKKVCWLAADYTDEYLDEQDDLYNLNDFFPSIEPLQGTLSCDSIHPVPDYVQYRQILAGIDYLQSRERILIKALRAKGVYDASMPELIRLVREADETDLVPVENFIAMQEKGGLANAIQYVDLSSLAQSLVNLYDAKERKKQELYEITGFSDIMRGSTSASESATAQQLKSEFGAVRLRETTKKIAFAAQELITKMVDLALARFQDQTILEMCGAEFFLEADKQFIMPALELIKQDKLRNYRIQIETDSTVAVSSTTEAGTRVEFLNNFANFAQQVINVAGTVPELLPAMSEAAMYAIRGMRQSAAIESSIDASFQALKASMEQPAEPPPPDPKVELEQAKLQIEQQKSGMDLQLEQAKFGLEQQKVQNQVDLEAAKLQLEREKIQLQNERDMLKASLEQQKMQAQLELQKKEMMFENQRAQYELVLAAKEAEKRESEEPVNKRVIMPDGREALIEHMSNNKKKVTFPDGRTALVEPMVEI